MREVRHETPSRNINNLDATPWRFSFGDDGRMLRIKTFLRSRGERVLVQRVGLLELEVAGENFRLMGPEVVSSPVFGESLFAGIEHPSALCRAKRSSFVLDQPVRLTVGRDWTPLPAAILGSCRGSCRQETGNGALRWVFLRYLDTVRVKAHDMHVHDNDWWTAPGNHRAGQGGCDSATDPIGAL